MDELIKELSKYTAKYILEVVCKYPEKQSEQKPIVIIPKFRVGDEIKTANEESLTITKIDEKGYWSKDLFICDFDEECLWDLVKQKPTDLKTKAGNWYVCDMEVMNENAVTAFHRDEIYYCPKDGYLDVGGALFEVGCLDVFRLATEKEIPQPKQGEQKPSEDEDREYACQSSEHYTRRELMIYNLGIADGKRMIEDAIKETEQKPVEWNNDEYYRNIIIKRLEFEFSATSFDVEYRRQLYSALYWLKSLRPQNRWKPSDEQLRELHCVISGCSFETPILVELEEQLKKL